MHSTKAANHHAAPLYDVELEAQVIGAVLREPALMRDAQHLAPLAFQEAAHQQIWQALRRLSEKSLSISGPALAAELGDQLDKVGGRDYLASLNVAGDALVFAFESACERIRELWAWRQIAEVTSDARRLFQEQDLRAEDAASRLIHKLEGIIGQGAAELRTKAEVAKAAIMEATDQEDATPTGIYEFDLLMHGGPRRGRLYGIGGFYGRGKTILMGSISDNMNAQGVRHLFMSLETPPEDVEVRNIARALEINASDIYDQDSPLYKRFLDNHQLYLDQVQNNTLYVHRPGSTLDEIQRLIIQAVHKHNIRGFLLDFWQLIEGKERGQSEEAHLRKSADRLAALCRREKIWGIVAAQTDERGEVAYCPRGLKTACSLYMSLRREPNDSHATLITEKSNYTRYANVGLSGDSGIVFDQAGPHFRSPHDEDDFDLSP